MRGEGWDLGMEGANWPIAFNYDNPQAASVVPDPQLRRGDSKGAISTVKTLCIIVRIIISITTTLNRAKWI